MSALFLLAASPARAGAPAAQDSNGAPIRAAQGGCVEVGDGRAPQSGPCANTPPARTWRILQNLIPQPTVTYTMAPPPAVQTVRFAAATAFTAGQAALPRPLRAELDGVLIALEAYPRVDRFEVVAHPDAAGAALAGRRADAVRAWFIEHGVPTTMISGRVETAADAGLAGRCEVFVSVRGRR